MGSLLLCQALQLVEGGGAISGRRGEVKRARVGSNYDHLVGSTDLSWPSWHYFHPDEHETSETRTDDSLHTRQHNTHSVVIRVQSLVCVNYSHSSSSSSLQSAQLPVKTWQYCDNNINVMQTREMCSRVDMQTLSHLNSNLDLLTSGSKCASSVQFRWDEWYERSLIHVDARVTYSAVRRRLCRTWWGVTWWSAVEQSCRRPSDTGSDCGSRCCCCRTSSPADTGDTATHDTQLHLFLSQHFSAAGSRNSKNASFQMIYNKLKIEPIMT